MFSFVHIGDDIALLFRCGGQVQHETGVEVFQHFQAQFRAGVVTFIHDHQGRELVDDLKQGGLVRLFNGKFRLAQRLGEGLQVAVLLVGFQPLFAPAPEGVIGQNHDGKLFRHGGGVKILPVEQLLLGVDLHPTAKIGIDLLAVVVGRIFQRLHRLGEDGVRGHQPYYRFRLGKGQGVKDRPDGVTGQKGLPAAGGHFEAEVGHPRHDVLILPQGGGTFLLPEKAEGSGIVPGLIQKLQIAIQVRNDFLLICFQLHCVPPPYLGISVGKYFSTAFTISLRRFPLSKARIVLQYSLSFKPKKCPMELISPFSLNTRKTPA